ncbi:MAG: hypothetical protein IPG25_19390 [Proteobacteria bacterium]|nr:hypothetical protein [Pseudomonadota bacterium]
MLTGPVGRPIDDPLLEFIAQVVAKELAGTVATSSAEQTPQRELVDEDRERRHLRTVLDRQAGSLVDRGSDANLPDLG